MPRNFSRHEQILRIFTLLDILSQARQPIDDQRLITTIRERLGLSKLSVRTLHRDCEFLVSCGYALDHLPLPGQRLYGWRMQPASAARKIPHPPITLLELTAFAVGRELLRSVEGTILWSGVESLRQRIEESLPDEMRPRMEAARRAFVVFPPRFNRYAIRPRLLSTLTAAITDCREIEIDVRDGHPRPGVRRVRPVHMVIEPPRVRLVAHLAGPDGHPPLLIDLDSIERVKPLDVTFTPQPLSPEQLEGLCVGEG